MKKAVIWNMLGTVASAGASMLLLIITTRLCGVYEAGIFSVAWITAQMLMEIGNYGIRAYQATDIGEEFSFKDYLSSRIITCIIMILTSIVFCFWQQYDIKKSIIVITTCFYRMLDAISDVYEGRMQQKNRMDLAGQALFFRTVISTIIFIFVLYYTESIQKAIVVAILCSMITLMAFSIIPSNNIQNRKSKISIQNIRKVLATCFPLFCSCFIMSYLVNAPKYAIDKCLMPDYQTYYNIISLPSQIIYLVSNFILKPVLTKLAEQWERGEKTEFKKYIILQSSGIAILTILIVFGGYFLGTPILSYIYRVDISTYRMPLLIVLFAGGLNALSNLLYYSLTVMRAQKIILIIYSCALVMAYFIPLNFVKSMGIMGATLGYFTVMLILNIMLGIASIIKIKQSNKPINIIE